MLADAASRLHEPGGGQRILSLLASMQHQYQQGDRRRLLQAALQREVLSFRQQTFASNTKKSYRTHRNAYFIFCNFMGYTAVPATTQTICLYASFLARSLKYNSVKQYLNIVRILHLEWGFPNPLLDNYYLRCVLQGMHRELGDAVNRKLPITPAFLRSILSHLDMSVSVDIVVWAACMFLFHGLLRRSNLMPLSKSTFDAARYNFPLLGL